MDWDNVLLPVLTVVGSGLLAWLVAYLGLRRFRGERIWDKKAEAYSSIFEALHHMKNRYDALREAAAITGELPDDTKDELLAKSKEAYAGLRIRLDREMWLIPDSVRVRLEKFLFDVDQKTAMSEGELYQYLSEAARRVMKDVRLSARKDLGVR